MQGKAVLTTGAIIFNNKAQVLLVRHTKKATHLTDTYGVPAGRPDRNEKSIEACIREVKEETGLTISAKNLKLLPHIYSAEVERKDGKKIFSLIAYYTTRFTGKPEAKNETVPEWIDMKNIGKINLLGNQGEMILEAYSLIGA